MRDRSSWRSASWPRREVARGIFNLPPWVLGAPSGDSLTYSNVQQQNRYLVDHSLRPLAVRIERAISGDPDLCPGGDLAWRSTSTACCAATPEPASDYEKPRSRAAA